MAQYEAIRVFHCVHSGLWARMLRRIISTAVLRVSTSFKLHALVMALFHRVVKREYQLHVEVF